VGLNRVRPYWLERQPDQHSAVTPSNLTARNWTVLGNLDSSPRSTVDERGLVTPWRHGWSLDWWIGADDRWHFPSQEAAIRQRLVDATPVVETAMRVPGGDAVHRAYCVRARGADDLLIIEIENSSAAPFAVAFAIRPYHLEGLAPIERIAHDDRTVTVDRRPALLLPGPPRLVAGSTGAGGDVVAILKAGGATPQPLGRLQDEARMAQAAFLYPLAHAATIRVAIPVGQRIPNSQQLPSAAEAARSWQTQTRRGVRLDLPPGALADAVDANRRYVLVFQDDVIALGRYGFNDEATKLLAGRPVDDGAAIWTLAEHWRLTGDIDLVKAMVPKVAAVAEGIQRRRQRKRRRRDPAERGLLDSSYAANFWALRGLYDGAELLAAAGEEGAAVTAAKWAGAFRRDLDASLAIVARRLGSKAIPASPHRMIDQDCADTLVACTPLHIYPVTDPAITATVEAITQGRWVGGTVFPTFTQRVVQMAAVDMQRGDHRALEWLAWLLEGASATWTWPTALHPHLRKGCIGDGHDPLTTAAFCRLVRDLLIREVPGGLALCSMLPQGWPGQPVEVLNAPTHAGLLSYAVRWHGDRPALLWELRKRRPSETVTLTAPGLDPRWRTDKPAGEALLAPVAPAGVGESFS
jgi:hypothetical protein